MRERLLDRLRERLGREDREQIAALEARLDHERLFPLLWVNRRVRDRLGNAVRVGPFAGLEYPDDGIDTVDLYSGKVLGSYEQELHPALEAAIAATPGLVVNIGAADGYYAVGLARRLPQARVVAFEATTDRHPVIASVADVNGVRDRVEVRGTADVAGLRELLEPGALVVCDCEGCERELLDPAAVPELASAIVIAEMHDHLVGDDLTPAIRERFAPTHAVEAIDTTPRYVRDFPQLGDIPLVTRQLAISEFRSGPAQWLAMTPRGAAPPQRDRTVTEG